MNNLKPANQTQLFGLENYFKELVLLENRGKLPNKILLSGQKGLGKSTLSYHFINYVLSKNEEFNYDLNDFTINPENKSFKTINNKTCPNFILVDINEQKKTIDIDQIRELISKLNKSSLNEKPRFILIDNIEYLNKNSINALLKILEEPTINVFFILINNNKNILSTLLSRCINFKISMTYDESSAVINQLLLGKMNKIISKNLINYYSTPGNLYKLAEFANSNNYDISNISLKEFLKLIIINKHYKKDNFINFLIFDLIENYFKDLSKSFSLNLDKRYDYFKKRISDTKKFNLDMESLFLEIHEEISNE